MDIDREVDRLPFMQRGTSEMQRGTLEILTCRIDSLVRTNAAMALNRAGARSVPDMNEVFTQIDNLTLARRVRLHLSTGVVPEIIWITLFAGAGLTVCFALFFGSPNAAAHLAMTAILSIVLASCLVVIIALDHPFSGPVHIAPEAIERVLAAMSK